MFTSIFKGTSTSDFWSSNASPLFGDIPPFDACSSLEYVVNHVFFPVYHPQRDDYTTHNAHALAGAVHAAACAFTEYIDHLHRPDWLHITKMLKDLQVVIDPAQPWNAVISSTRNVFRLHQNHPIWRLDDMEDGGRLRD